MSHKHDKKLLSDFWAHPVPMNVAYKDVVSMLGRLGATIEEHPKSKVAVTLAGHTMYLHHADHSLNRTTMVEVRKFLESCGITPDTL
ncbi:MAG: hypothetical protein KDA22_03375 [Phycisphaerales bacterium]|nr:hypothetical protein [Phycisphaerales bacterium]